MSKFKRCCISGISSKSLVLFFEPPSFFFDFDLGSSACELRLKCSFFGLLSLVSLVSIFAQTISFFLYTAPAAVLTLCGVSEKTFPFNGLVKAFPLFQFSSFLRRLVLGSNSSGYLQKTRIPTNTITLSVTLVNRTRFVYYSSNVIRRRISSCRVPTGIRLQ